ncbi:MAG: PIN domain-containing protein [Pirellulales bacterium]|nr:PIN domain-containing protein [Pirellulales bacterium]
MHRLRVYVDTSVIGGVFDEQFSASSRRFFEEVKQKRYAILISAITYDEMVTAPDRVRQIFESLPADAVEEISIDSEVRELAAAYIAANILGPKMENDALHVAAATVARADMILSWNFRHMVNFNRILKFNGVNMLNGYSQISIHSPLELANDDENQNI